MDSTSIWHHFLLSFFDACHRNWDKVILKPYDSETGTWSEVTFGEFLQSMKTAARYWKKTLNAYDSARGGSKVVAVWVVGASTHDLITILGLSLAGYVPQPFSKWHSGADVIYNLMKQSGATILLADEQMAPKVDQTRTTLHAIPSSYGSYNSECDEMSPPPVRQRDMAFIFCSSGTTSATGSPKIIPVNCLWLKNLIYFKMFGICCQRAMPSGGMTTSLGSYAHVATITGFLCTSQYNWGTVQTPSMSTQDLLRSIKEAGVNVLFLYAGPVADLLRAARENDEVKGIMKSLHEICHCGWPLPVELEDWANEEDIKLVSFYGNTEAAPNMTTDLGGRTVEERSFRILPGSGAYFIPFRHHASQANHQNGHANDSDELTSQKLVEMVVPADAEDAPHHSLFSEDGFYHLEDVFEEVVPGRYAYRGRFGDFIRMDYNGGLCDAKSLEDVTRKLCKGEVYDCVVVGTYKPTPGIIVELNASRFENEAFRATFPSTLLQKLESHNKQCFPWERVTSEKHIIVVKELSLPRTEKGNIKRPATEKLFRNEIDSLQN